VEQIFEPGDIVSNPAQPDWGIGQVQSMIAGKITVNFEHIGKVVILSGQVKLRLAVDGLS
jgi:hypothetical protein